MQVPFPTGVFAPMVTPFGSDGIDEPATRRHVAALAAAGAHGIVVAGSGGEFVSMSIDERRRLTEVVLDELSGAIPTMVCVAASATAHSVELARHARDAGAATLLATAPYFLRPPREAVRRHLAAIQEAAGLPLMLYNSPTGTGIDPPLRFLEQLVEEGAIQGVKQSYPDGYHVRDAKRLLGNRAAVFVGADGSAFEGLVSGADGWISVVPVVLCARAVRLWESVRRNDPLDALRAQWEALLPFVRLLYDVDETGSPHWLETTKHALSLVGHDVGPPRPPFAPLEPRHVARLREILRDLGGLADS